MPTPSQMQLPRSKSPEEFECLCKDVLPYLIQGTEFEIYGRKGQLQNGIDLYSVDQKIVVQCKNYFEPYNLVKQIKSDYSQALQKLNIIPFETFIAMTALQRDVKIQNEILQINRKTDAPKIKIYFWEDIAKVVCENIKILRDYYPSFFLQNDFLSKKQYNKMISCLSDLKNDAYSIHDDYFRYRPAYHRGDDYALYRICKNMFLASIELSNKLRKNLIQLNSDNNLGEKIEDIIRALPDFHDAQYGDAELVCTIEDFLSYFRDEDKFKNYVDACDEAIKLLYQFFLKQ
ncbi:MAG: hypothetical protein IJ368_03915 [Oscillospiraceae bacterium]|nr:hypothetical protein [Oscillospiraceae bacterium]